MAEDDIHFQPKIRERIIVFLNVSVIIQMFLLICFTNSFISIAPVSEMIRANVVGCWVTSNPLGTSERSDDDDRLAAAVAGSGKNLAEAGWVNED
jgi:hypothetical protein